MNALVFFDVLQKQWQGVLRATPQENRQKRNVVKPVAIPRESERSVRYVEPTPFLQIPSSAP
jgi:hypothetical protein